MAYGRMWQQLGKRLRFRSPTLGDWAKIGLPWGYYSVKEKCHVDGQGQVCSKPGHACMRRICSWVAHPHRKLVRGVAKAAHILCRCTGLCGNEVQSLRTAPTDFLAAWSNLCPHPRGTAECLECRQPTVGAVLAVLDCANMFETLDADAMLTAVEAATQAAQAEGYAGVAVLRSRRQAGWLQRSGHARDAQSTFVPWARMNAVLRAATLQRAVRIGQEAFLQVTGVPIGGLVSRVAAAVIPGRQEMTAPSRVRELFPRAARHGLQLWELMALRRYVDDAVVGSRTLCKDCLAQ
jgi:hypothetical protein